MKSSSVYVTMFSVFAAVGLSCVDVVFELVFDTIFDIFTLFDVVLDGDDWLVSSFASSTDDGVSSQCCAFFPERLSNAVGSFFC